MNQIDAVKSGTSTFPEEMTFVSAKARAMFECWTHAIQPVLDSHDVLNVELEFQMPLLNPETESASRTFVEAGKIDAVIRDRKSGLYKVLEHKTTSDSIESDSNYWPRLTMDTQPSKYVLYLKSQGLDCFSSLYDVVKKPGTRPSQIPLLDAEGNKVVRDAFGSRVTTKDGKKWRQTADTELGYSVESREETPVEFYSRNLEYIRSNMGSTFAQREIARTDVDLLEYMNDAWAHSQTLLYFKKRKLWPRNPSACLQFGTCEFLELCASRASVDGVTYAPRQKHAELEVKEGDKEFLTNSRLSTLRRCARLHFLRYEEPIERVGEKDEALLLGTMFHNAAEAYLKHFVKQ